jgi:hypothetical protein
MNELKVSLTRVLHSTSIEINQTCVFFVFSQVTDICVGEKGETQAGSEPTSLAMVASALTNYTIPRLGALADMVSATCITASFFSLFEGRSPMLARSFNLQAGTSTHTAYIYIQCI